jgi:hypothetical protein
MNGKVADGMTSVTYILALRSAAGLEVIDNKQGQPETD